MPDISRLDTYSVCREPSESLHRETIDPYFVSLRKSLAGSSSPELVFSSEHSYIVLVDKMFEQDVNKSVKQIIRNLLIRLFCYFAIHYHFSHASSHIFFIGSLSSSIGLHSASGVFSSIILSPFPASSEKPIV